MKNLTAIEEDTLESLPSRLALRKTHCTARSCKCERRGGYSWVKVHKWLRSKVGLPWSRVTSCFLRLPWMPEQYRTYHTLCKHVNTHTFLNENEEICYYSDYVHGYGIVKLADEGDVLYVHPVTGQLAYKPAKPHVNWAKLRAAEEAKTFRVLGDYHQLLKLGGIWYEVKGEPIASGWMPPIRYYSRSFGCSPAGPRERLIIERNKDKSVVYSGYEPLVWLGKITLKRQLNTQELKKHKLSNGL